MPGAAGGDCNMAHSLQGEARASRRDPGVRGSLAVWRIDDNPHQLISDALIGRESCQGARRHGDKGTLHLPFAVPAQGGIAAAAQCDATPTWQDGRRAARRQQRIAASRRQYHRIKQRAVDE
jgi:hypothetical protein